LAYGAIADRYINLDFTGRRFFSLVETESCRWSDYVWNDGKGAYNAYRETIDFGAVESVSVWLQNLAPGQQTKCRLGPIRALPLRAGAVKNPRLTVGGKAIEFPVELASGSWIECNGPDDCAAYGSRGEPLGQSDPTRRLAGARHRSAAAILLQPGNAPAPRARVRCSSRGNEP